MKVNRVGQQLGNYQLLQLIRQGGFSEVYLGRHIYLETEAAIKVLHKQPGNEARNNFLKEARTIARLVHPHIIRVLDFGVEDHTPFLVMDYAPNGSVRKRYPNGSQLPLLTIVLYVRQAATALHYAHEQGLIHCDVKPENMLLGRHDDILLSDFGIALAMQGAHAQSTPDLAGTVTYMAPEQILGTPCPASDQYALGTVVYEWLCGERPFHGTLIEIIDQQLAATPPPLREKVPGIPAEVEEVVLIALAKDPRERFASTQAFANALTQASQLSLSALSTTITDLPSPQPVYPVPGADSFKIPVLAPIVSPVASAPASSQPGHRPQRKFSRRALVSGVVGATLVAASGAGILFLDHALHNTSATTGSTTPRRSVTPTHEATATPTPRPTPLPLGTTLYVYHGHHKVVKGLTWSPLVGLRIASASFDTTVQIWDAITGAHVLKYNHHTNGVKSVAWSPVGSASSPGQDVRIASGGLDKTVRVWNATTGQDVLPVYSGHSANVRSVVWSPDGLWIASGGDDRTVQVWNATSGKHTLIYRGHTNTVNTVVWSPNAALPLWEGTQRIASASFDGTVQLWDALTGGNILIYRGHFPNPVRAVAWSPDGKYLASGGSDKTVQVWDVTTGHLIRTFYGHTQDVQAIAWSPDGLRLASGSFDRTVKVWDVATGHIIYTYTRHTQQVWAVAWSPDGQRIASGSADNSVQVWQAV
jgi:eukaryotic-like serine/threonine-protein kinase